MNPTPPPPDDLAKIVHSALRSLPDRRAPHTLERRVLAAIEAQAARPWWRQSWSHWPVSLRAGFILFSLASAASLVTLVLLGPEVFQIGALLARMLAPLSGVRVLCSGVADAARAVVASIPTMWLYGAFATVGLLYAALFGVGAAAYRTLVVQR
jgi:hypothetical protein